MTEKLIAAAIKRHGEILERGFTSHYQLRTALTGNGDRKEAGDIDGFVTNSGKFVTRKEAVPIAVNAGQLPHNWLNTSRDLLSSDINW